MLKYKAKNSLKIELYPDEKKVEKRESSKKVDQIEKVELGKILPPLIQKVEMSPRFNLSKTRNSKHTPNLSIGFKKLRQNNTSMKKASSKKWNQSCNSPVGKDLTSPMLP